MSDSESLASIDSDDSEWNYIPGPPVLPNYEEEVEDLQAGGVAEENDVLDVVVPYQDEPLASAEFTREYRRQRAIEEELQKKLKQRLDGADPWESWCKCGNCRVETLQNVYEARCCHEIEKCVEALQHEEVLADVGSAPNCMTLHPGFRPNCLEKWALKHSARKYKTRDERRYKKLGSEEKFLRAVAYREFSHLVYGFLGSERISHPACVYHAIRKKFASQEFTGFEEN